MADKDFVIKNGLVVGDTATINGVQIDPSGASSNQVLKFNGTKFAPASEGDISGTVYVSTIGDGTNSSYTITHGFGTRNVVVVIRNASSPYEVINARWEATTTNSITVDFSSAISSDSIVVSVYSIVTGISTGSSYYENIGNGTDSSFTLTHNFNTRDVVVTARNVSSPYEVINVRWEAETANTVVVDFSSAPSSNSVRIGVYATVSGSAAASIDDLGDVTITSASSGQFLKYNGSAWVNDAIDLGTDTTGNYVSGVSAGTGISVTHTPGEGSTATVGLNATLDNLSDVTVPTPSSGDFLKWTGSAWVNDSIDLGTDTTGNYVQSLVAGTGVTLANNSGEGATPTVSIGQSVDTTSSPTFANLTVSGSLKITTALEIASVSATASTGTINIDFLSNPVVYYTSNASANWTLNIRGNSSTTMNTVMSIGDIATVTFMAQQGSTAYYANTYQIDGTTITPKWQGGTAPTSGNASSIDSYVLSIIKTAANTYTMFASQTKFA